MIDAQEIRGSEAARAFREFLATYDGRDASDRQVFFRVRERVHAEIYRRERDHYPEYVDLGGEA